MIQYFSLNNYTTNYTIVYATLITLSELFSGLKARFSALNIHASSICGTEHDINRFNG